jgi:hypothetical protein
MAKNKQRAVSILLFLGGILALMATWNLPESPSPQVRRKTDTVFLRKRRQIMAANIIPKGNYFLVGLKRQFKLVEPVRRQAKPRTG